MLKILFLTNLAFTVYAAKRIVNGVNAEKNEYPFMVSLQNDGAHFCGGTVLNKINILTSYHCVCDLNIENFTIKITPLKLDDTTATSIPVANKSCNNYDPLELINDVAILQLKTAIPKHLYHPVKLPSKNFSTSETLENATLIGWGLTTDKGSVSNILQKVQVVVYSDEICEKSYYGIRNIQHHICSGWPKSGRGSCQGDSGGPLLINDQQIGIISFGMENNCGLSNAEFPKISARVTQYLDWINKNTVPYVDNSSDKKLFNPVWLTALITIFNFIK